MRRWLSCRGERQRECHTSLKLLQNYEGRIYYFFSKYVKVVKFIVQVKVVKLANLETVLIRFLSYLILSISVHFHPFHQLLSIFAHFDSVSSMFIKFTPLLQTYDTC